LKELRTPYAEDEFPNIVDDQRRLLEVNVNTTVGDPLPAIERSLAADVHEPARWSGRRCDAEAG
jgi:hypothetical protein